MSVEVNKRVIGVSTANVFDPETILLNFMRISEHAKIAVESGLQGIEIFPNRVLSLEISIVVANGLKETILGAHQSPRNERWSQLLSPQALQVIKPLILLPGRIESLNVLKQLIDKTGDLPVVLYEKLPHESSGDRDKISTQRLVQIRPETSRAWNTNTIEAFIEKMHSEGFTGICLDTTHLQRSPFSDWKHTIPKLCESGVLREVHLAIGRVDLFPSGEKRKRTVLELSDVIHGHESTYRPKTDVLEQLKLLADCKWNGTIIIEALPSALKELLCDEKREVNRITKDELIAAYEAMRKTILVVMGN